MDRYDSFGGISITNTLQPGLGALEIAGMLEGIKMADIPSYFEIDTGGSIHNGPIIHDGVVYFGACDKTFYALDYEGRQRWRFATDGPIIGWPSVGENMVFVGSFDNCMYCLDSAGRLIWKFPTSGKVISSPLVIGGVAYFGSRDQNLYAVSLDGRLLWKFPTEGFISCSPVAYGNNVIIGSYDKNLYCIAKDGSLVWKFPTTGLIPCNPVVHGNLIILPTWDGQLYCLRGRKDGAALEWKVESRNRKAFYNPIIVDSHIVVGCRDGVVRSFDLKGRQLWESFTNEMAGLRVGYKDGVAYFGSADRSLCAVNAADGSLRWKFDSDGMIAGGVAVGSDRLFFGTWNCNLYCLGLDGRLLWKFRTAISNQSAFDIDVQPELGPVHEVVWKASDAGKKEEMYKFGQEFIGEQRSLYGSHDTDYMGAKKEYLGRKKGYR